jgi:hypothetical protein
MKKSLVVIALAFGILGATAVAQMQPPMAGPEHKRLAYFAGTWTFSGEAKASAMGPAGTVTFKEQCTLMDGGFALVCSSEGKSPMGPSKASSIMAYDAQKKAYTYTAAESNMPVFTAMGQVANGTWTWMTESPMGGKVIKTRVTVTESGPTAYMFKMEMAVDKGAFAPVLEGKATKVTS